MSMIGNFLMVNKTEYKDLLSNPDKIEELLYETEHTADVSLDIDKTWNIIHFLLTGTSFEGEPPERDVIIGGIAIGEIDVGYGPARILDEQEVKAVAKLLKSINAETLLARFDKVEVAKAEIYPEGWEGSKEDFDYITDNYNALIGFYQNAAEKELCVVQYLN